MKRFIRLVLLFFLLTSVVQAQVVGLPDIKYYNPRDYHAGPANYSFAQGDNGKMYVANDQGILEFDGHRWELIPIGTGVEGRWLTKDENGKIYVGAHNDLGYLENTKNGTSFRSFLHLLDSQHHSFQDIWEVAANSEGIYFRSVHYLFRYNNGKIKVWEKPEGSTGFDVVYIIRDTVYTRLRGLGIVRLINDEFVPVNDLGLLADTKVNAFLPYKHNKVLICTRYEGIFLLDKNEITPFNLNLGGNYNIYDGRVSPDSNYYVFPTLNKGILITDIETNPVFEYNSSNGLAYGNVLTAFYDYSGKLWFGLEKGIAQVDFPLRLVKFDENFGIDGKVKDIIAVNDYLYIATSKGVYYLNVNDKNSNRNNQPAIRRIANLEEDCLNFYRNEDGTLTVSTSGRDYLIKNFEARKSGHYSLPTRKYLALTSRTNTKVLVDYNKGIHILRKNSAPIQVEGINEQVRSIAEDKNGNVLMGTLSEGVICWALDGTVSKFYTTKKTYVGKIDGDAFILMDGKVLKYNDAEKAFEKHPLLKNDSSIAFVEQAKNGDLLVLKNTIFNTYIGEWLRRNTGIREQLPNIGLDQYNTSKIWIQNDCIVWIGGIDGLIRWDTKKNNKATQNFESIISKVVHSADSSGDDSPLSLPYASRSIQFYYSSNIIPMHGHDYYQYKLEGYNEKWSEWTPDFQKDYIALEPGSYTFMVRARNSSGEISGPAALSFIVNPPWWRMNWVLFLAIVIFGGLIYLIFKIRLTSIQRRNKLLKRYVKDRTAEIAEKSKLLKQQKEELEGHNVVKDKLLSIVSHDIRGPLNTFSTLLDMFIAGDISSEELQLLSSKTKEQVQELNIFIENLVRWAKHSLDGINPNIITVDLSDLTAQTVKFLKPSARSKDITLHYENYSEINVLGDEDMIRLLLRNLMSNAIKFSKKKSIIKIEVKADGKFAKVAISDSGAGISTKDQKLIFSKKSFSKAGTNNEIGTGLGLSLCQEFIDSMGGEIGLDSELDKGSTFWFLLPISQERSLEKPELISDKSN